MSLEKGETLKWTSREGETKEVRVISEPEFVGYGFYGAVHKAIVENIHTKVQETVAVKSYGEGAGNIDPDLQAAEAHRNFLKISDSLNGSGNLTYPFYRIIEDGRRIIMPLLNGEYNVVSSQDISRVEDRNQYSKKPIAIEAFKNNKIENISNFDEFAKEIFDIVYQVSKRGLYIPDDLYFLKAKAQSTTDIHFMIGDFDEVDNLEDVYDVYEDDWNFETLLGKNLDEAFSCCEKFFNYCSSDPEKWIQGLKSLKQYYKSRPTFNFWATKEQQTLEGFE